jgi:voltage-dependent calcium channel L type alpha-1D
MYRWFERFIILVIFLNSIFLATYDYGDRDDVSTRNQVVEVAGRVFTCIFTAECVLKIVSYGFIVHTSSYLRDGWNWLDFIVVIIGWIELLPNIPNLKALRTLRILRPLRSINAIPSMKN